MAKAKKKRKATRSAKARKPVRNSRKTVKTSKVAVPRRQEKVGKILKNLGLFVLLFVASIGLYYASSGEFMMDLFWFSALITGLVSVSLILAYLVFFFLRLLGK